MNSPGLMSTAVATGANGYLLAPGLWLEHCDNWVRLCFEDPRPALSCAAVGGGVGSARQWLNLKVSGHDGAVESPQATIDALCRRQRWPGDTVAMMTAASMNSLRIRHTRIEDHLVMVAVTSGLANARRIGDPAEYRQLGETVAEIGTINLAVVTDLALSQSVMMEAAMAVTEAKVATLQQRGVRSPVSGQLATGTGTDAIAVFAGDGTIAAYAGKHTLLGETLGRLALQAIGASVDQAGTTVAELCTRNLEIKT